MRCVTFTLAVLFALTLPLTGDAFGALRTCEALLLDEDSEESPLGEVIVIRDTPSEKEGADDHDPRGRPEMGVPEPGLQEIVPEPRREIEIPVFPPGMPIPELPSFKKKPSKTDLN